MSVKRVEINEKVGISADFVTILERGIGYRGGAWEKRKGVLPETQVHLR